MTDTPKTDLPERPPAPALLRPINYLQGVLLDGRYRLLDSIATGGMGTVWRGRHELMRREVAVKILPNDALHGPKQVEGFKREIDMICEMDHPNIVQIYDAGYDEEVGHYAAMRMLAGTDLAKRIANGPPLGVLEILAIAEQTGRALEACHRRQVIHRDIKPENIFLATDPNAPTGFTVRVLDFGVSMVLEDRAGKTATGKPQSVAGTPYTMSPEQIRGKRLDPRTDIYSFGILLFELFTGRYPFTPESVNDLLRMQVLVKAPLASEVAGGEWLPLSVVTLLARMLEKDRNKRPTTMTIVLRELEATRPSVTGAWADAFMGGDRAPAQPLRAKQGEGDRFRTLQLLNTEAVITQEIEPIEPYAPRHMPSGRFSAAMEAEQAAGPPPFRVAIVDDEPAIRMLVKMVCDRAGVLSDSYESGEAVLADFDADNPPDAMILDLLMPGIDGIETLMSLRKAGYEGPVIVCSTLDAASVRRRVSGYSDVVFMDKVIEFNRMHDLLVHWSNLHKEQA